MLDQGEDGRTVRAHKWYFRHLFHPEHGINLDPISHDLRQMRAFRHKRIPIIAADRVAEVAGEALEEPEIVQGHQDRGEHLAGEE